MLAEKLINTERCHGGALDKIARYGWEMTDDRGELEWLSKNKLEVDETYQRDVLSSKARELAANWSWIGCGCLTVVKRGERYFVIDGQHRVVAARNRSDIKDLPCIVFSSSGVEDEASAFLLANTNRKPVTALGKFKAQVISNDETAVFVKMVLDDLGFKVGSGSCEAPMYIKSMRLCYKLAQRDRQSFFDVMSLVSKLCEGGPSKEILIDGLFYLHTNGLNIKQKNIEKRIIVVGRDRLLNGAKKAAALYAKGGAKVWADGMLIELNKGSRTVYEMKK